MPYLAAIRAFFTNGKYLLIIAVLLVSHLFAMEYGAKRELRRMTGNIDRIVEEAENKGKAAVKRATNDLSKIAELERDNERLRKEAKELGSRPECKPTPDELRILNEISQSALKRP